MRKPNQDLAYQMNELRRLHEVGVKTLQTAKTVSDELEDSMRRTRQILESIPNQARTYQPERTIDRLLGTLQKPEYDQCLQLIERNIPRLIDQIPQIDQKYAEELRQNAAEARTLSEQMNQLKEDLTPGGGLAAAAGVYQGLEQLSGIWEQLSRQVNTIVESMIRFAKGEQKEGYLCLKDPINVSTGNFIYDHEDLMLPGLPSLSFKRYYNALDERCSELGKGWSHSFGCRLLFGQEERVTVLLPDGCEEDFYQSADGDWFSKVSRAKLAGNQTQPFCYQQSTGAYWLFDQRGRTIVSGKGEHRLTYHYEETLDQTGRLLQVEREDGAFIRFSYHAGLLAAVSDSMERQITYRYEQGHLTEADTVKGDQIGYRYDADGRITAVINARQICGAENVYDQKGRVLVQRYPDGGEVQFVYDDHHNRVTMIEQNGNQVVYEYDQQYRIQHIVYEDGEEWFGYNAKGQKVSYTDARKQTVKYRYDEHHRLQLVTDPLGNQVGFLYGQKDSSSSPTAITVNGERRTEIRYDQKGQAIQVQDALGRTKSFAYNEKGLPLRITYPDGSTTVLSYDAQGNVLQMCDPTGVSTGYQYDNYNRVIKTIDGAGNPTSYTYDQDNRLKMVTNAEGSSRHYEYNESGKLIKIEDFDGSQSSCSYNAIHQMERLVDQEGNATEFVYDQMWNLISRKEADGAVTRYRYDRRGRLSQVQSPLGGVLSYQYDRCGNLTKVTEACSTGQIQQLAQKELGFVYDALNRMSEIREGNGQRAQTLVRYVYDAESRVTESYRLDGHRTLYVYDAAGQLVSQSESNGQTLHYTYSKMGKIESVCDQSGRTLRYSYGSGGRLLEQSDSWGEGICWEYDLAGRVIRECHHNGMVLGYEYDSMNRVRLRWRQTGTQTKRQTATYHYDKIGRLMRIMDEKGAVTSYEYSSAGHLTAVTDALGRTVRYLYDCRGKVLTMIRDGTDGTALVTEYQRDALGNVLRVTDPLGAEEWYQYDAFGRQIGVRDQDGRETRYGYDTSGALAWIGYDDGSRVEYSYDALRRLQEVRDWSGATRFEYNLQGHLERTIDGQGQTVSYEWGQQGERKAVVYPDGARVEYGYDHYSRLISLQADDFILHYNYDEAGRLLQRKSSNGRLSQYKYDEAGRLSFLQHSLGEERLEAYEYQYDESDRLIEIKKERRGAEQENGMYQYAYDALNRLSQVAKQGMIIQQYQYDTRGNRIAQQDHQAAVTRHYTYDGKDQLIGLEELKSNGGTLAKWQYGYDQAGNLQTVEQGGVCLQRYEYGANRRLLRVSNHDGTEAQYFYNGLGIRTAKKEWCHGQETKQIEYLTDLTKRYQNLLEKRENGVSQQYLWDHQAVLAKTKGQAGLEYLQDYQGSTLRVLGAEETIYGYDVFGEDLYGNQGQSQPFGYTGYQKDLVSGNYFAQAREYHAETGRFQGQDQVRGSIEIPQTLNRYSYCYGDPLQWVDLDGRTPSWSEAGKFALEVLQYSAQNTAKHIWQEVTEPAVRVVERAGGKLEETGRWLKENIWDQKIYGVDKEIYTGNEGSFKYSLTAHGGGDVIIRKYNKRNEPDGGSINFKISVTDTLSIRIVGAAKSWNPQTWSIHGSGRWTDPASGVHLNIGQKADLSGSYITFSTGGKTEALPVDLPFELDPNMYLKWSISNEKYIPGSRQAILGGIMAGAITVTTVLILDDVTLIGIGDDGLAVASAAVVLASVKELYESMIEFFAGMAEGGGCLLN